MVKRITALAVCLLFIISVKANGQNAANSKAEALQLFSNFYGQYRCRGGNARGQKISADVSFTPTLDGKAMVYEHIDYPPLKAHSKAIWSYDAASKKLVSLSVFALKDTSLTTSSLFVGQKWSADSLMLKADTLVVPPFKPNRFIYKKNGNDSLKITWQVKQDDRWVMGDYLECTEQNSL